MKLQQTAAGHDGFVETLVGRRRALGSTAAEKSKLSNATSKSPQPAANPADRQGDMNGPNEQLEYKIKIKSSALPSSSSPPSGSFSSQSAEAEALKERAAPAAKSARGSGLRNRQAMNTPIQSLASDIMKFALVRLDRAIEQINALPCTPPRLTNDSKAHAPLPPTCSRAPRAHAAAEPPQVGPRRAQPPPLLSARLLLQIHDELLLEVRAADLGALKRLVAAVLPMAWADLILHMGCLERYADLCLLFADRQNDRKPPNHFASHSQQQQQQQQSEGEMQTRNHASATKIHDDHYGKQTQKYAHQKQASSPSSSSSAFPTSLSARGPSPSTAGAPAQHLSAALASHWGESNVGGALAPTAEEDEKNDGQEEDTQKKEEAKKDEAKEEERQEKNRQNLRDAAISKVIAEMDAERVSSLPPSYTWMRPYLQRQLKIEITTGNSWEEC
eukprot:GHVT01075923.1.p1 GENE.GHVT01075923.1~~GHVT01075923.1.p1  ORF type:complete len:445 (-),score=145.38 GHVT01075923.1:251-1585(-)